jgi:high frequency lysogenization protein
VTGPATIPARACKAFLVTNPTQPLEVFGATWPFATAIAPWWNSWGHGSQKNAELTRYVVSLIALERKLAKRKDILNMLGERISQIGRQQQHFDLLDEQILANMASIYSDLISPIGPRIQVAGTPLFLQQPLVQHKVRALLLAGIRACVLWRQLGGSRTQIIFARKKMVELAKRF